MAGKLRRTMDETTSWNRRLVRHTDIRGGHWYQIHEVYYNAAGEIVLWSANGIRPGGEDLVTLTNELREMLGIVEECCFKHNEAKILDADKLPATRAT